MNARQMAQVFHELMIGVLAYKRFGAQGGDWGAAIVSCLSYDYPGDLIGIHLNLVGVPMPQDRRGKELDESEKRHLAPQDHWRREEMGYRSFHATKPQTLAYALNDSPAGGGMDRGEVPHLERLRRRRRNGALPKISC